MYYLCKWCDLEKRTKDFPNPPISPYNQIEIINDGIGKDRIVFCKKHRTEVVDLETLTEVVKSLIETISILEDRLDEKN